MPASLTRLSIWRLPVGRGLAPFVCELIAQQLHELLIEFSRLEFPVHRGDE